MLATKCLRPIAAASACVSLLLAAICWGATLDAPTTKRVTIGSEIQRGFDAVFEVTLDANPTDLLGYTERIEAVFDREKQKNTDSDAYLLGASLQAWSAMSIALRVNRESSIAQDPRVLASADGWAWIWFRKFRVLQKQLSIDDKVLISATPMKYEVLEPEIRAWSEGTER